MTSLKKTIILLLLLCFAMGNFAQSPKAILKIYWTDPMYEKIQRSNLNGSGVEDIVTGIADPRFIMYDNVDKIYFTHDEYIKRANMDGSDIETVLSGLTSPMGIALDFEFGTPSRIFWTDNQDGTISSAYLDGSDVQVVISDLPGPFDLAIYGDELYWTDEYFLSRAKLDGSNIEGLYGLGRPRGFVLDLWNLLIYWTDDMEDRIHMINFDGTGHEVLIVGRDNPKDIALDLYNKKIVWTEYGGGNIQYADYSAWNPVVLIPSLGTPLCVISYINPFGNSIDEIEVTGIFPNPASGSTTISYKLNRPGHVQLTILDNKGSILTRLVDQKQQPGNHQVTWNAIDCPPGIYYYQFRIGSQSTTGKIIR